MVRVDRSRPAQIGYRRYGERTRRMRHGVPECLFVSAACRETGSSIETNREASRRCPWEPSPPSYFITTPSSGQLEGTTTHGHLLHQVPGMVVFSVFTRPFALHLSAWTGGAATTDAPTAPAGLAIGRAQVRRVRAVSGTAEERDGVPDGVCFLLPVCVRLR